MGYLTGLKKREAESGFTLLELIVTLAIVATLSTMAIPNVMGMIERNRVTSAADQLHSALGEARKQAVMGAETIAMTASEQGFSQGWCLHEPDNGNPCEGDGVIETIDVDADVAIIASHNSVEFDDQGYVRLEHNANPEFQVFSNECQSGESGMREFSLNRAGNVSVNSGECP